MTLIEALQFIICATAAEIDPRSMRICDVARAALANFTAETKGEQG